MKPSKMYQIVYDVEVLKASSPTPKESMFKKGKISKVKKRASHVSVDAPYYRIKKRLMEEKNGEWLINAVALG